MDSVSTADGSGKSTPIISCEGLLLYVRGCIRGCIRYVLIRCALPLMVLGNLLPSYLVTACCHSVDHNYCYCCRTVVVVVVVVVVAVAGLVVVAWRRRRGRTSLILESPS